MVRGKSEAARAVDRMGDPFGLEWMAESDLA